MATLRDITGLRFGRLQVMTLHQRASRVPRRNTAWSCRCDCGRYTIVTAVNLVTGNTLSCGCLRRELITTHGQSGSPEYCAWNHLLQRCTNTKDAGYKNYGGRDRKSTRLNSSHVEISYAVFCLK